MTTHHNSPTDTSDEPELDKTVDLCDLDITVNADIVDPKDYLEARMAIGEIIHRHMPGRTLRIGDAAPDLREWADEQEFDVHYIDVNGVFVYEGELEDDD